MKNNKLKFNIFTLGCQMNVNESERLRTIMQSIGYEETNNDEEADVVLVNACSIRQSAIDRIYGRIVAWNKIKKNRPLTTILTGCVLDVDRRKLEENFDYIINRQDSIKIPGLLGRDAIVLEDYLSVPPTYNSNFQAYVSIMEGCDKFCTYCVVPYTRGREISRSVEAVLEECKALLAKGYKEITLLGQNVNSYKGKDSDGNIINFAQLLAMVAALSGEFWLYFTTSHPYDMTDELVEVIGKYDKIGPYLNLPVQSGDDAVLKRMNRHYTVVDYKEWLNKVRDAKPGIAISTDLIIGFSGESETEFANTIQLLKEVKYDMVYLNKYSERPGTLAAKKFPDDIPWAVKKEREKLLNEVLHVTALEHNKKLENKTITVLVERSEFDPDKNIYINNGRTASQKAVLFESNEKFEGEFVPVKIITAKPFSLRGVYEQ